ncbi:hypothetical protein AURDEDRAFT_75422 [Auricularia subglabra TFB-10046 SS5]|uniref:Uncharacterized protein n=1 Tax=Auricularia subglabra (strain TFB-10046 / SS5) TaxID=717982 RepID=J0WSZ0_AURST|nr:hypothetical protein AURDEDRAFT_75422 [Auricularia subglabra TFB-10046 SS5]
MDIVGITQRRAHEALRSIRRSRTAATRRATTTHLDIIKHSIQAISDYQPNEDQIWRSLKSPDLSRNVRVFLWKAIHGAHKVGEYFKDMPPPWKARGDCPTCGTVESLAHILFSCPDSGQERIWAMVHSFLTRKRCDVEINLGVVLGCATARLAGAKETRDKAVERAFRIVISESAFLIWKLRCEKRVGHSDDPDWQHSQTEIIMRWGAMLKQRVARDQRLTNKYKYGVRAVDHTTFKDTWHSLAAEVPPSPTSDSNSGVLVGREERDAHGIG